MDKRTKILFLIICGVVLVGLVTWLLLQKHISSENERIKQPHIVFILADDLGWNDPSFHGSKHIPTPNLDSLALDGIVLNRYYVAPVCTPSRAALMTAKYPIRFGLHNMVLKGSERLGLPLEERLLPEYLKSLNYSTYGIGKWNLGHFRPEYLPMNRGFDSFFGAWVPAQDYYTHIFTEQGTNFTGYDLHDNFDTAWNYSGVYGTELLTQKAIDVILNHDPEKPLFLFLSMQAPHWGNKGKDILQVPDKYIEPLSHISDYESRLYYGMVSSLDQSIGKVFEALDESGIVDNTLLVFTSDNGPNINSAEGTLASNYPLKGGKQNLWEGGVRVAGFVWSSLLRSRSRVSNEMMHIVDWLPTLLSAAGSPDVPKVVNATDGVDMWPTFKDDKPSSREEILLNIDGFGKSEGYIWRNFKLLMGSTRNGTLDLWSGSDGLTIRGKLPTESQNLINVYEKVYKKFLKESKVANILQRKYEKSPESVLSCQIPGCDTFPDALKCGAKYEEAFPPAFGGSCNLQKDNCLFDVVKDPCEYNNIIDQHPEVVEKMKAVIDRYRPFVVSHLPIENDPAANPQLHGGVWNPWM